jgi:hypothetical protein
MREIDLLPDAYHLRRRRRYLMRRNAIYAVAVALALGCLHLVNTFHLHAAEAALTELTELTPQIEAQRMHVADLQRREQTLLQQIAGVDMLEDDAPLQIVLAEVARQMGDVMALRSVVIETGAGGPSAVKKSGQPEWLAERTRGRLTGIAADDMHVGIFLGRLAQNPLFEEVKLGYSCEAYHTGYRVREFEIRFTVRRVRIEPGSEGSS